MDLRSRTHDISNVGSCSVSFIRTLFPYSLSARDVMTLDFSFFSKRATPLGINKVTEVVGTFRTSHAFVSSCRYHWDPLPGRLVRLGESYESRVGA